MKKSARQILFIALLLAAITIISYSGIVQLGFVTYDDEHYLTRNTHVQNGLTWKNAAWAFSTLELSNWHPLTWLSHMLDWQMHRDNPIGHHVTNLLLHTANVILLFVLLNRMTGGAVWRSALVAALFAVHPLHVESVAWVSERKDVLSTFFGLLAMLAYVRYVESRSMGRFALVMLCFALSLMSKPMLVTLPFVLLLLDVWPLGRLGKETPKPGQRPGSFTKWSGFVLEKLPLLVLSAASSIVAFRAQQSSGAMSTLQAVPIGDRLANAVNSYVMYIVQMFWPAKLAVFYPRETIHSWWMITAALCLLLGVTLVGYVLNRQRPWLVVGWLWYLGTLVPVIGLVQVGEQARADRYTYFPLIGLFIMIAWSIPASALFRKWTVGIMVLVVGILMTLTWRQVRVWKSGETLFEHAIAITGDSPIGCYNLGVAKLQVNKFEQAAQAFTTAITLRSHYAEAHGDLALALFELNQVDQAMQHFRAALAINRNDALIRYSFGTALARTDQFDEAIIHLREATRLQPDHLESHINLANALSAQKKFDEAIQEYRIALELDPRSVDAHYNLGNAYLGQQKFDAAVAAYRAALLLNTRFIDARLNLGFALAQSGHRAEAIQEYQHVLTLSPNHAKARELLEEAGR